MKEWRFEQRGQFPLSFNAPILKLWNPAICPIYSGPPSYYDTVSKHEVEA
jgi:hypothetical protein